MQENHIIPASGQIIKSGIILSDEQVRIVNWYRYGKKNAVVRARAGTGKTFTSIVGIQEAPEKRIGYFQFNKKNQLEVSAKITDPRVEVKTLHAVGFYFVKKVWNKARPDNFVEGDRVESIIGRNEKAEIKATIKRLVGFAKNVFINPSLEDLIDLAVERDCLTDEPGWNAERVANACLQVLELSKRPDPQNRISFDDMVWLPCALGLVTPIYDLVVIDEAQDMNLPQLEMARLSSKGRVCVVGDDRQAIYHFRGAASNGLDMMKQVLNAEELSLTVTRRCPKQVVSLAVSLVPDYKAADDAPEGTIDEVNKDKLLSEATPGQAILSRLNAPLMPLCLSFIRNGKPAKIEGRDIGKALGQIVKKLNARSVPEFLSKLDSWGTKQVSRVLKGKNGDRRASEIQDQVETLQAVAESASSVSDIITKLETLFTDVNGDKASTILLSSTHKAKGLEWDRVYLLADTFNRNRGNGSAEASKEESNIYYVALTRSKGHLTFVR